ncbi:hypothetical protein ACSQ6I_20710 [Anabaena sp. WFMT]|uniref:hypothetical protein n=1 Tax=Anabaena sp. WFMT TaxID=3449730 RepID=UPI003F1EE39F
MAAIMNYELYCVEVNTLCHKLTLEEMESTIGGNTIIPLWNTDYADLYLSPFTDWLNNVMTTDEDLFDVYNNKIFTIDFSDTNVYLVV